MRESHPEPDEIVLWVAGHLDGSPRFAELEVHLAACASPCGEYVAVAAGIVAAQMEEHVGSFEDPPPALGESRAEANRQRDDAMAVFVAPPADWTTRLEACADRSKPMFLSVAADRAVYYADEHPEEVLGFLEHLDRAIERSPGLHQAQVRTLRHLAAGIADRTLGEHLAALQAFEEAERWVASRPMSFEYARICLGRAGCLRLLERFPEAEQELVVAGQVFARLGLADCEGLAKVYHQRANVAWQAGDPRRAFRMARVAASMFHNDGQEQQARMALDPALSALIAMRRVRAAGSLLAHLEQHAGGKPHWSARLLWKRGKLAALRGEVEEAAAALQAAAERLGQAGSPLAAAQALLDLAHLAAGTGDLATQTRAAGEAAQVLATVPGHPGDLAQALARLQQALRARVGLAEIVSELRSRLQRR